MILRERFGMTYRQAHFEEPDWYVETLLAHHRAEQQQVRAAAEAEAQRVAMELDIERQFQALEKTSPDAPSH